MNAELVNEGPGTGKIESHTQLFSDRKALRLQMVVFLQSPVQAVTLKPLDLREM
jgi:hypothetical protein